MRLYLHFDAERLLFLRLNSSSDQMRSRGEKVLEIARDVVLWSSLVTYRRRKEHSR